MSQRNKVTLYGDEVKSRGCPIKLHTKWTACMYKEKKKKNPRIFEHYFKTPE